VVIPAHQRWSLDARSGRAPAYLPRGAVWLLRGQTATVYVFAGLAKLDADWLFHARPLRFWLPASAHLPLLGPWLNLAWVAHVASVAGLLFDLAVVPALLWRRTRPLAWVAAATFHLITWLLFPIGVFPWLMTAMATVFFEPSWPGRVIRRSTAAVPARSIRRPGPARVLLALGVLWMAVQLALPMRGLAYPGDRRWTNEGYRFSWIVLLTEKGGWTSFRVTDTATGRMWVEDGSRLFTPRQLEVMASEPDLIHQAARAIAAYHRDQGRVVEVRADAFVSLNGRPAVPLIDPDVDLAAEPRTFGHRDWILPPPPG
jgi:hypothetical protein